MASSPALALQEVDHADPVIPLAAHLKRPSDDPIELLHVDDDAGFADMTAAYLERVDDLLNVATETDPREALDRFHRDPEAVECIVCDYQMPGMDGLEVLETVRADHSDLPFVLFTGKGSEEVASEAIAKGVTEYMQKGTGTDHYELLANRIRNAVEQYRIERAFWTTLTWYQRLCEQSLAGTYLVHDRAFVYVNEKFAEVFGYTQADLIGADVMTVVAEPDRDTVAENLRQREQGERETIRYRFTGERKDGARIAIEVHGGAIEYRGEPGVLGILSELPE